MLVRDSLDTYELLDNIIAAGDKVAFDYFLDLIYANNPIENVDFSATSDAKSSKVAYFNDEKLEPVLINGVPFYTIPAVNMIDAPTEKMEAKVKPAVDIKKIAKVYFETNKSNLQTSYYAELDQLITMLKNNPSLGIEIAGYADAVGNKQYNLELSNKRASSVLEYFNSNGISRRRILAKGFGQTSTESNYKNDTDKQKDRKVEIRILEM
jgi:outer membrane protein OmpA-like peptidoglycan-associated protein